ncbi:ferredoxin [Streptomyces sp. NPDC090499]|jgi:ferredoxin|uniref:ferredoxin n=1 Tax=unclassified Streptomyces TaxID=2593676 RepID=UPI003820668A
MQIVADRNRCCGTATCVAVSPRYFGLDPSDRRVRVLSETPTPEDVDEVEEAVEMCPTSALDLTQRSRTTP